MRVTRCCHTTPILERTLFNVSREEAPPRYSLMTTICWFRATGSSTKNMTNQHWAPSNRNSCLFIFPTSKHWRWMVMDYTRQSPRQTLPLPLRRASWIQRANGSEEEVEEGQSVTMLA